MKYYYSFEMDSHALFQDQNTLLQDILPKWLWIIVKEKQQDIC